jgi:hypothetical protein
MEDVEIKVLRDYPYEDEFVCEIINKNYIKIERVDKKQGWWFDFNIQITNKTKNIDEIVIVKKNPSSCYQMQQIEFDMYEEQINVDEDEKEEVEIKIRQGKILNSKFLKANNVDVNKEDNIVIVTSIINIYDINMSIISNKNRLAQTILTLKSIIVNIPNSKIIILEQSKNISTTDLFELSVYSDYVISYSNDEECDYYSNIQKLNKGLGEMYVMTHFCKVIENKEFNMMYKIVGRYSLTNKFNFNDFLKPVPTFKIMPGDGRLGIIVFSNFYTIPQKYLKVYLEHQNIWLKKDRSESIEHILTLFVESLPEMNLVTTLNIKGYNGITGKYIYM